MSNASYPRRDAEYSLAAKLGKSPEWALYRACINRLRSMGLEVPRGTRVISRTSDGLLVLPVFRGSVPDGVRAVGMKSSKWVVRRIWKAAPALAGLQVKSNQG